MKDMTKNVDSKIKDSKEVIKNILEAKKKRKKKSSLVCNFDYKELNEYIAYCKRLASKY